MTGYAAVAAAWLAVGVALGWRRRGTGGSGTRVDTRGESWPGVALQCGAFLLAAWPRERTPVFGTPVDAVLAAASLALLVLAVWLFHASVRALGPGWSLVARADARRRLVTGGPYARVRHPIYLAMLGMILGTGGLVGAPPTVAAALALYAGGTAIRVRCEESLLRRAYGPAWMRWAERVPAWIIRPRAARSPAPIEMRRADPRP